MVIGRYWYIAARDMPLDKVGTTKLVTSEVARPELGKWLLCDGRELWAADYPELASKLKRTLKQRFRGVFTLPDLN